MTEDKANKIYNLLVSIGGAKENERTRFVNKIVEGASEWRFRGLLGFGGKYSATNNKVSYYSEEENEKRFLLRKQLNSELEKI